MSLNAALNRLCSEVPASLAKRFSVFAATEWAEASAPSVAAPQPSAHEQRPCLVFVNGVLDRNASVLHGLQESALSGDSGQGYTLTLADQTCLAPAPLALHFTGTAATQPTTARTHLRLVLGTQSRLTVIETHESHASEAPSLALVDIEITLGAQAKLIHAKAITGPQLHLAETRVTLAEGAFYDAFTFIAADSGVNSAHKINLDGTGAQAQLQGLTLGRGRSFCQLNASLNHTVPHTQSRQIFRSVLADQALVSFHGKIAVAPDAQKTDAHQISRALILSDQAEMHAKPDLEINADDVQCSHGSTMGCIDDDALFYLRARGLDEAAARALLVRAFIDEMIDTAPTSVFQDLLRNEAARWTQSSSIQRGSDDTHSL